MLTLVAESDAQQVVTLAEAKEHLRLTLDTEDDRTMQEVDASISWAEDYCRRPIRQGQWRLSKERWQLIDGRPSIRLLGQIVTVDSIEYKTTAGVLTTISTSVYDSLIGSHSTLIREAPNQSWPALAEFQENIRVTFTSGWSGSNVPYAVKQAVLLKLQAIHDSDDMAEKAAVVMLEPWRLPPW